MILHNADAESIVLLENRGNTLPLRKDIGSIAVIGPQADRVTVSPFLAFPGLHIHAQIFQFGDYVFFNASLNGITPLAGFKQHLASISSSTKINYAEGSKLWSNDESQIAAAVNAAKSSDVAIVLVSHHSL